MLTLGEARGLLKSQLGGGSAHSPDELDFALSEGLRAAVSIAADVGSERMLISLTDDLSSGVTEYTLPSSIYSIKGVRAKLTESSDYVPLSPISFPQSGQADNRGFGTLDPYGFSTFSFAGYWITHRTLHLSFSPSASVANGLKVFCWATPSLPQAHNVAEAVPWPDEATRYILAEGAMLIVPPPPQDMGPRIEKQLVHAEAKFRRWLHDAVKDIAKSPIQEGSLGA